MHDELELTQRELQEAERVRAWLERRNYEENRQQAQPVVTARAAESDEWAAWNRWADSRIQRYFEAHVEQLVQQRVAERTQQIRRELTEVATAVRKAVTAMAQAIDAHDKLIRELTKRDEPDARPDQRALRVVN
jgi:hypothetical protein